MVRFAEIVLVYFIVGAVLWTGGALDYEQNGLVGEFVEPTGQGDVATNNDTVQQLEQAGGPIRQALSTVGGGALLAVYDIVAGILSVVYWPVTALVVMSAPVHITVAVGGGMSVAFVMGFVRLIRGI